MSSLFNEILYRPLFNLLIAIYNVIPGNDFGVAIILMTIIVRLVLMPLSIKALVSQRNIAKIQPKLKELQKKHKDNKQLLGQETMALYKEYGVNPLSGCLPLLIQLPLLFALYQVFVNGFKPENLSALYGFVHNPVTLNVIGLGFIDLSQSSYYLAILAGLLQFIQSKKAAVNMPISTDKSDPSHMINKQMLYFLPILITIIAWRLPAGLGLYWVTTTLFSIFEQVYMSKKYR